MFFLYQILPLSEPPAEGWGDIRGSRGGAGHAGPRCGPEPGRSGQPRVCARAWVGKRPPASPRPAPLGFCSAVGRRRPQPEARAPLAGSWHRHGPGWHPQWYPGIGCGRLGSSERRGRWAGPGPLGFSPEPFSQGELGTRARKGGGESTAGGFVSAAGLQTLHKMEGGGGWR